MKIEYRNNGKTVIFRAETPEENDLLSRGAEYEFAAVTEIGGMWSWVFVEPKTE